MAALGRQLRKTADELSRQIRNLKAIADVDAWDSKAGKEFREKAKGNVGKLEAAFKRYDTAADAIGGEVVAVGGDYQDKLHAKSRDYASDLNRAQEIADAALKDAKDADNRKGAAQRSLDGLPRRGAGQSDAADKGDQKAGRKKIESQRDAAGGEIEAAREKIGGAKRIRDDAAKRAREAIDEVISDDSLKDGFWDRFDEVLDTIATWTANIATVLGVVSLLVGWIPVIGQALAGLLGSLAMLVTLLGTLVTLVQFIRGDATLMDLGMSALGFLMMGVGKAFSKVAGKYAKVALERMGKSGVANTAKQSKRAAKGLNKLAGDGFKVDMTRPWGSLKESVAGKMRNFKLEKGDGWKSMKEPFMEPFSGAAWKQNLRGLRPGNFQDAGDSLAVRGDGNAVLGIGRSFSMADPGVASRLKDIKFAAQGLGSSPTVNRISNAATGVSLVGSGVTLGGLALDSNLNPLLD
ncbi:hypothetical protein ACFVXC_32450 [Streptomyces sp. NPDC058257]|uniref:hypothetical protein n=1 Tax=Streptomyces sp. NPDC058257 TaxID=3346409 RepID=UPI0036E30EF8